jgi:galactose mutarotase-like enzyme
VFNGTRYKLPINDVAGLNNSLHGLLWNKALTVLGTDQNATAASVQLGYAFNGSEAGYPFLLTVKITYTLSASGFQVKVEAANDDPNGWPLPFYNGWHPYFLATLHTATLQLDPCTHWNHVDVATGPQYPPPRYSNMVPTGHTKPWHGALVFDRIVL